MLNKNYCYPLTWNLFNDVLRNRRMFFYAPEGAGGDVVEKEAALPVKTPDQLQAEIDKLVNEKKDILSGRTTAKATNKALKARLDSMTARATALGVSLEDDDDETVAAPKDDKVSAQLKKLKDEHEKQNNVLHSELAKERIDNKVRAMLNGKVIPQSLESIVVLLSGGVTLDRKTMRESYNAAYMKRLGLDCETDTLEPKALDVIVTEYMTAHPEMVIDTTSGGGGIKSPNGKPKSVDISKMSGQEKQDRLKSDPAFRKHYEESYGIVKKT